MQCVSALVPGWKSSAACAAIRRQRSTSSSWSARARSGVGSSCIWASAHGRLTAVGLDAARTRSASARSSPRNAAYGVALAAHGHVPDRVGDLGGRLAAQLDDLVRQPALVKEDDRQAVLLQPHDLLGV